MKYQKFEQHISESLRQDTIDLDIDALIQDIHGQKPKRRVVGFWWMAAPALLIIGGMFYLLSSKSIDRKEAVTRNNIAKINEPTSSDFLSIKNQNSANTSQIIDKVNSDNENLNKRTLSNKSITKKSLQLSTSNFNLKSKESLTDEDSKNVIAQSHSQTFLDEETETFSDANYVQEHLPFIDNLDLSPITFNNNQGINPRKVVCPDFSNKTKFDIAINPELGAFLPMKSLEYSGSEFENVYQLRSQNEKPLEGIYAGIFAQVSTPKWPIYLKTGITWSRLTEKMNLNYSYTKKDTTQGIISITYSQTGDTITAIIGDIITERKLSGSKARHHQFQLWDIPIGIGYERSFGRWFTSLEVGVNLNLSNRASGSILQSDTSFVDVNKPKAYFKDQLGLSYFAGANIGRWIQNKGRIYLSARFRMIPNQFNADINGYKQQYNFLGLNLGYSHLF